MVRTAAVVWHVSTRAVKAGSTATAIVQARYSKTAAYTVHTCTVGTLGSSLGLSAASYVASQ